MKITRWLAAAGILTLLILIVLTTVLVVPTMAFQGGQTVSAHTILARSGVYVVSRNGNYKWQN